MVLAILNLGICGWCLLDREYHLALLNFILFAVNLTLELQHHVQ